MQKWFAFILLIIVAVAVFIPCCTTDNCEGDQITSTSSKNHPSKQESACSPFYSCSSCSGFVFIAKAVHITAIPAPIFEHLEHPSFFAPSPYTSSLLEPPKFSISSV